MRGWEAAPPGRVLSARSLEVLMSAVPGWNLSLYPDAAEAGGCFVASTRPVVTGVKGSAANPERARQEAARRARARVRRYCAANRLNRLGTLTYEPPGCHDPLVLREDVGRFFRRLRAGLGGDALPYLWVPEWHKTDHGQHVHFAVGRYVKQTLIEQAWGQGFVSIKRLGDVPVGTGALGEARRAAGYLSKYVTKSFDVRRVPGLHRFDVAQGFRPHKVVVHGVSCDDVIEQACAHFKGLWPDKVWRSSDVEDWQGPPAVWASWAA